MTQSNQTNTRLLRLTSGAGLASLGALLVLATAGCGTPKLETTRPEHHIFIVKADGLWQNSGVYARQGAVIHCLAEGKWSDGSASYGPEGNPDSVKTHLGVKAPGNSLLMRMSNETNKVFYIGKETNIVATSSSYLLFRNNVSLSTGMNGEITVDIVVANDADRDRVPDYEEIYIWKMNPLSPDSDGDGFKDADEVARRIKFMKRQGIEPPTY